MVSSADILNARILIVDDKEANIRLLEGMLRVAGYTCVESTTDPSEVCELHRKNRYGLILLDLQMPGMDGFQVMECLKEIEQPVIFRYWWLPRSPVTSCARSKPAPRIS
jgi:CheY-like chemotaxis protein